MAERLVTLMRFPHMEQAEFHREMLENEGIEVVIADERRRYDGPTLPDGPPEDEGGVLLQVAESDVIRAGEILEEGFDEYMGDDNPSVR